MTAAAVAAADALVLAEGAIELPSWSASWVYAGGTAGARDVLGAIASSSIGVAGTNFSITVAALTLASTQMGPRLLRNFTRDLGNQYALGALVATFALTALRPVREMEEGAFVPQLAVTAALLLAFACVGVLIWFLHHVATSIDVMRAVALVYADLADAIAALPPRRERGGAGPRGQDEDAPAGESAPPTARGAGYLRVLDEEALADRTAERGAVFRFRVRPGDFVFPDAPVGEVRPAAAARAGAEEAPRGAMALGDERSVEQGLECAVRQLVEIALRALSPSLNDPFTAIAVLDRLSATLCSLAQRQLPNGRVARAGRVRVVRPCTDYAVLLDAMFHMLRESGAGQPAAMIRLLDVLVGIASVERDPARRREIRRHVGLAAEAALRGTPDGATAPWKPFRSRLDAALSAGELPRLAPKQRPRIGSLGNTPVFLPLLATAMSAATASAPNPRWRSHSCNLRSTSPADGQRPPSHRRATTPPRCRRPATRTAARPRTPSSSTPSGRSAP